MENILVKEILYDVNHKLIRSGEGILCRVEQRGEEQFLYVDEDCLNIQDDNEVQSCNNDIPAEGSSDNLHWGDNDTRLLLDLYAKYLPEVGPLKMFKNKKQMWKQICSEISEQCMVLRTPTQCESRYKTVLKRKNVSSKINKTSGEVRQPVEFEEEIEKIKAIDDSLQPEILMSANNIKINDKRLSPSTSYSYKKKMRPDLGKVLKQIHEEKESNKERRHQEKLDLLKQLFGKELENKKK